MTASDLLPAASIAAGVGVALAAAQCLPSGPATVLVRAGSPDLALALAARSHAALVGIPFPGAAALHGDAARIRSGAGFTLLWRGAAPCGAPRP